MEQVRLSLWPWPIFEPSLMRPKMEVGICLLWGWAFSVIAAVPWKVLHVSVRECVRVAHMSLVRCLLLMGEGDRGVGVYAVPSS